MNIVKQHTGWDDKAPVMGEAFIQWVIEDDFINGRPALENVDVEMVESVFTLGRSEDSYSESASHSCISLGRLCLIGLSFIDESTRQCYQTNGMVYVTKMRSLSLSPSPRFREQYRDVLLAL